MYFSLVADNMDKVPGSVDMLSSAIEISSALISKIEHKNGLNFGFCQSTSGCGLHKALGAA